MEVSKMFNFYEDLTIDLNLDEMLPFWREESNLLETYSYQFIDIPEHQKYEEKYYWFGMIFLTGKDPQGRPVIQNDKVALQYLYQAANIGHKKSIKLLEKIDDVVNLINQLNEVKSEVEMWKSELLFWNDKKDSEDRSYYLETYLELLNPLPYQLRDLMEDIDDSKEQLQAEFLLTPSEVSGLINNYIKGVQEC